MCQLRDSASPLAPTLSVASWRGEYVAEVRQGRFTYVLGCPSVTSGSRRESGVRCYNSSWPRWQRSQVHHRRSEKVDAPPVAGKAAIKASTHHDHSPQSEFI